MDVHQALDWVNALSKAESDGGEVSGLNDVSWADSASEGSLIHGQCALYMYKFDLFITIQQYYLSFYLENQGILVVGKFYPLAVLGIQRILAVLV